MCERRIEKSLHKTLQELQRLTLIRNLAPPEQIEPERPRLAHGPGPWVTKEQGKIPTSQQAISQRSAYPDFSDKNHGLITQNKPNLLNPKINPTSVTTNVYGENRPPTTQKNKPKQTQSQNYPDCRCYLHSASICPRRNATSGIPHTTYEPNPDPAVRDTQCPIRPKKLDTYPHRRIISLQTLQMQRSAKERSLPKLP